MNGSTALYTALKADATVLSLLSTVGGNKCIIVDTREPLTWGVNDTTISIYRAVPVSLREEGRIITTWTVNCRASTIQTCEALAQAVIDAVNRQPINTNEGRFYCTLGFMLQPVDENDSYNLPVEVEVLGIKSLN